MKKRLAKILIPAAGYAFSFFISYSFGNPSMRILKANLLFFGGLFTFLGIWLFYRTFSYHIPNRTIFVKGYENFKKSKSSFVIATIEAIVAESAILAGGIFLLYFFYKIMFIAG